MPRVPFAPARCLLALGAVIAAVAFAFSPPAAASPCVAAPIKPETEDRDQILAEARAYARSDRYRQARALFRWLIDKQPTDQEAWLGVAQVDAWEGCYGKAEQELRDMLARNPRDLEARAGLIDVLMWEARWDEAATHIERGLAFDAQASALLLRQAKLLYWSGEVARALEVAEHAQRHTPNDEDIRALRRRLYRGQARALARVDSFPSGLPSLYTLGGQGIQRAGKFELSAGTLLYRYTGGGLVDPLVDGRHTFGVLGHPGVGATAGMSVGFGAPAHWVPSFEAKVFASIPVAGRVSGYFAYAWWQYRTNKTVHIFAPALVYSPREDIHLELKWWTSYVVLEPLSENSTALRTGVVHAVGLLGAMRVLPQLTLNASYVYGAQLDENPALSQLFPLRSHVATVFGEWALGNDYGVQPLLGFERRQSPMTVVLILSAETGIYVRW